jgi:hypothetical protein
LRLRARRKPIRSSGGPERSPRLRPDFPSPEPWIRRVIAIESNGRTIVDGHPVVSKAGAMGLMQLMPGTWSDMRALLGLRHDPEDPRDNILAGTFYLRLVYDRLGYPGLFAAYYAFLADARPLPPETLAYLRRASASGRAGALANMPARFRLFAALGRSRRDEVAGAGWRRFGSSGCQVSLPGSGLFVPLTSEGTIASAQ